MKFVKIEPRLLRTVAELADASGPDLVYTLNALTGQEVKRFKSPAAGRRRVEAAMMAAIDADAKLGVPKGQEPQVRTLAELEEKARSKGRECPDMHGADVDEGPAEPQLDESEFEANPETGSVNGQMQDYAGLAPCQGAQEEPQEGPSDVGGSEALDTAERAPEGPVPFVPTIVGDGAAEGAFTREGSTVSVELKIQLGDGVPVFPPHTLAGQLQAQAAKVAPIVPRPAPAPKDDSAIARSIRRRMKFVRLADKPGVSKVRAASLRGKVLAFLRDRAQAAAEGQCSRHIGFDELVNALQMPDAVVHVHKLAFFDHVELCNADGTVPEANAKAEDEETTE